MPRGVKKQPISPVDENKFQAFFKSYSPNEKIEISPPSGWVLPNRVKFSNWVHETFHYDDSDKSLLFPSQRFVKDFLQYDSPYRGLLLYHGLGLGKSMASIVTAENLIGRMDVVILLPASLRNNYIDEIKKNSGNSFFSVYNNWKFYPISAIREIIKLVAAKVYVSEKTISKNKGIWVPMLSGSHNWSSLQDTDKAVISKQLDEMIQNKYKFINYNGVQGKDIDALTENDTLNPFDNKVIIVDEVHNLISRTVGNGRLGKRIYELVLNAKRAKLVLLSGTPMINYPYELAFLINLLKGPQYVHELRFDKQTIVNTDDVSAALDKHLYVDNYTVDPVKKLVFVQLAPSGFKFADKNEYMVVREAQPSEDKDILTNLAMTFKCKLVTTHTKYVLPINKDEFMTRFINSNTETVHNPRMLARRMMGSVSYFGTYFGDLYPRQLPSENVVLEMSDIQFLVYEKSRFEERSKEDRAKKYAKKAQGGLFDSSGQVYRAYSRANCNFVFPDKIERPYPSKVGLMNKEVDWNDDDKKNVDKIDKIEKEESNDAPQDYHEKLTQCMNDLRNTTTPAYLQSPLLAEYSPKFDKLLDNLSRTKGKALMYSQFRTVEGLGVFSIVLEKNGWAEFKIKHNSNGTWDLDIEDEDMDKPKYFQYKGSEDETKVLMKIFNNDLADMSDSMKQKLAKHKQLDNLYGKMIKLIMITQSGAEGISLKHVREVHVLEPYWNEIRINQVIGRAVRANSHTDLPAKDQTVKVFTYMVKLKQKHIKGSHTIQTKDKSKTTDEYIFGVAQRKANIINAIQDLMKDAAADCLVHSKYHDKSVKCLGFPQNLPPNSLSYTLEYEKEEDDDEYKQRVKVRIEKQSGFKKCTINNKPYAYDPSTHILYDHAAYTMGKLIKVSKLVVDKETGIKRLVRL